MNERTLDDRQDCFVTVAVVIRDAKKWVASFVRDIYFHLDENFTDYEILLIDQCSTDGTKEEVKSLLKEVPSMRFIELSAIVYSEVAMAAAVENSIGDFVVLFTPGLDPIESIVGVVDCCRAGNDVVIGIADQPQTFGYKVIRPWMRWGLDKIGYSLPKNATDLRCLSRRAVNMVTRTGRYHHQFLMRMSNTGYPTAGYEYKTLAGFKNNKKTLYQGARQTSRMVVFNSTKPLRWMSALGILGSLMAFIFALYSILVRIFKDNVVEGWTTLVLFMAMLFMLLFTILAFFGEYLGRLLDDRSEQTNYFVAAESVSSVMSNDKRINVMSESG